MYLKINIPDIRLIPLKRITYYSCKHIHCVSILVPVSLIFITITYPVIALMTATKSFLSLSTQIWCWSALYSRCPLRCFIPLRRLQSVYELSHITWFLKLLINISAGHHREIRGQFCVSFCQDNANAKILLISDQPNFRCLRWWHDDHYPYSFSIQLFCSLVSIIWYQ